jgi:hypothetical protein
MKAEKGRKGAPAPLRERPGLPDASHADQARIDALFRDN